MLGPSKDVEGQKNVFLVVMKTKQESKFQMKKPGGALLVWNRPEPFSKTRQRALDLEKMQEGARKHVETD